MFLQYQQALARIGPCRLENGATYETRYSPVEDGEAGVTRLLTDVGNWIAVVSGEIASVESQEDEGGFGHRLDSTPRFLGWILIEDRPIETEDAAEDVRDLRSEPEFRQYSVERFLGLRAIDPGEETGIPLDCCYGVDGTYLDAFDPMLEFGLP